MKALRIGSAVDLLWRAVAVFRIGAFAWVAVLVATRFTGYARPALGWVVLAVMAAWTGLTIWAYADSRRRTWWLLSTDLTVALGCLAASYWVLGGDELGRTTLPMAWVAAPVIAWAIHGGRRVGAITALAVGAADAAVRGWAGTGPPPLGSLNATVLLVLAGAITGYLSRLAADAQRQLQEAAQRDAATRERERLARGIHDSVLQVLALVQRRGAELGGEAAQLGRLAGEQEATLRALVSHGPATPDLVAGYTSPGQDGTVDLRSMLNRYATASVTIAVPAEPVSVPAPVADELAAAVAAALDNVRAHCGPQAPAWLLLEAEPEAVVVLDLQLPDLSGVAVIHGLADAAPAAKVLVLSASGEHGDVLAAVKAGATGYLVKSAAREEFLDAVARTAAGDAVFTAGLAGLVLGEYRRLSNVPAGEQDTSAPQLTERETEVLRLVAKGLSYKQIAERLVVSHRTVQNHVQNTLGKLQLHNRVELTRYAIEQGLDD